MNRNNGYPVPLGRRCAARPIVQFTSRGAEQSTRGAGAETVPLRPYTDGGSDIPLFPVPYSLFPPLANLQFID